jgi:hypothetical protein
MLFESLEGRMLMSASAINPTITADRLAVKADLLKFRLDIVETQITTQADIKILKADGLKNDAALLTAFKAFQTDVKTMHQQLFSDNLNEKANVLGDQLLIVEEKIQILKDKGNATALAAGKQALLADRVKLQTDEIAGLNSRITTRQTFVTTLTNDLSALVTAAESDPNASPQLQTDIQKFSSDRSTQLGTLTTDLQTITAARTQLASDLTALENT